MPDVSTSRTLDINELWSVVVICGYKIDQIKIEKQSSPLTCLKEHSTRQ